MNSKSFLIFLSVFAILNPLNAQYDFDAIEKARMAKANVKVQTQWTCDYVNGKPADKGYRSTVTKYDTKGNVIEITNYSSDGKLISTLTYRYDNRGNPVSFERSDDKREVKIRQLTVYDAAGNKIRESGFNGSAQFPYSHSFTYDATGRLTEVKYMENNALVERRAFKYTGNKTEVSIFDGNDQLTFRQESTYTEKGMLLSEVRTGGANNAVVQSLNMQHNSAGDLTEEVKKRADNKLEYQKLYQYDKNNRPIKVETVNLDGTKFVANEYQYNSNGDLILESWKKNNKTPEPSTKKYTYDAKGLYTDVDCYFSTYKLQSLYKYTYEFY